MSFNYKGLKRKDASGLGAGDGLYRDAQGCEFYTNGVIAITHDDFDPSTAKWFPFKNSEEPVPREWLPNAVEKVKGWKGELVAAADLPVPDELLMGLKVTDTKIGSGKEDAVVWDGLGINHEEDGLSFCVALEEVTRKISLSAKVLKIAQPSRIQIAEDSKRVLISSSKFTPGHWAVMVPRQDD